MKLDSKTRRLIVVLVTFCLVAFLTFIFFDSTKDLQDLNSGFGENGQLFSENEYLVHAFMEYESNLIKLSRLNSVTKEPRNDLIIVNLTMQKKFTALLLIRSAVTLNILLKSISERFPALGGIAHEIYYRKSQLEKEALAGKVVSGNWEEWWIFLQHFIFSAVESSNFENIIGFIQVDQSDRALNIMNCYDYRDLLKDEQTKELKTNPILTNYQCVRETGGV